MVDDKTICLIVSLTPDSAASADVARFTNPAPAGVAATNVKIANPFVLLLSSMLAVDRSHMNLGRITCMTQGHRQGH